MKQVKACQIKSNQEPPKASITIEERMYSFELIMYYSNPYKMGNMDFVVMNEILQITHQVSKVFVMRWNKDRIFQACSQPVLTFAKLSR